MLQIPFEQKLLCHVISYLLSKTLLQRTKQVGQLSLRDRAAG